MNNSFIMTESIVRPAKMPYGRLRDNGFIGIEGEHAARALVVETKDDLSAFVSINLIIDDLDCGAMTKTTSGSTATLSKVLTSSMIGRSGKKICQLIMVNSDNTVVQKSSQFEAYVGRANEIERSVDDGVTIIILSEAVTEMAREAVAAASITVDDTLTQTGQAADAAETGRQIGLVKADLEDLDDRVEALESGGGGSGLTDAVKTALMNLVNHIAWDDDDPTGQTYITALQNALYPPAELVSISAVYTQSGVIYESNTLDDLKDDLVVTALMSDQTTRSVTDYSLSGTLIEGTSTITVSYSGKTTTFNVTVSHEAVFVRNIIDYATVVREHAYGVNNNSTNNSWPEVVYSIPNVQSGDVLILPNGSNEAQWATYRNIGKTDQSSSAPQLTLGEWVKVGSQYGYYPITVNEDLTILYVRFNPTYSSAATWTRESGF